MKVKGRETLERLADCYDQMGLQTEAERYRKEAAL